MKRLLLSTALVASSLLVPTAAHAHGGNYRGPGDTVPPGAGGSGGGAPGPAPGPSDPGSGTGSGPTVAGPLGGPGSRDGGPGNGTSRGPSAGGLDLTAWSFWWEFNKAPYLDLKAHLHREEPVTDLEGFDMGRGQLRASSRSLRPTDRQIRDEVVPALLEALRNETHNDIVTGAMIALAKIGDAKDEGGKSLLVEEIRPFLADNNQEISETAAVSLGILADGSSIRTLHDLIVDEKPGRALVQRAEVSYRTRAFAAFGLGLIGANPNTTPDQRSEIVSILAETLATDDTKTRDLAVACVISMGLVPLKTGSVALRQGETVLPPHANRDSQLRYLLGFLRDDERNPLVRAHCPTSLARLLAGHDDQDLRDDIVRDLLARIAKSSKERDEIVQSSVLALGLLGDTGPASKPIREALASVAKDSSDEQSRNFALIALGKVGGAFVADGDEGIRETGSFLLGQISDGRRQGRPWAGLSLGVLGEALGRRGLMHPLLPALEEAVRTSLVEEKSPARLGAYAISCGIMHDLEAGPALLEILARQRDDEARGYVALGLGLLGNRSAIEPIQRIVAESRYRPELMRQAAIGLGLLGDKSIVGDLTGMLDRPTSLAAQAAVSSALGIIGDQSSIPTLIALLRGEKGEKERARGFAAVALGIVADKEPLPWNSKIGVDLNYRAATSTLVDSLGGTGILDLL